ncbi:MAG: protein translocase subunit SecF [Methanomicrobiaceae archaeon]|nr:protein translocase subunit SecF [Methanomicrobiaceae archaeon]
MDLSYNIGNYTPGQMAALPIALFILALIFLGFNTVSTGMPVNPGIDFAGGVAVTIFTGDTSDELRSYFQDFPLQRVQGLEDGKYLVFSSVDDEEFEALLARVTERYPDAKVEQIGETFGRTLQEQATLALLLSLAGMSVVVFIAFRTAVPSLAVVLSAVSDITISAAFMDVLAIPLSLGTTAALLMLIGYSVDSDILLTTRVLKRKGKVDEKLQGAFRTGFIMTTTTLTAVFAMFIVSSIGQVTIIREISTVLLIGLVVDLANTWLLNAGILKWYLQRRGAQ